MRLQAHHGEFRGLGFCLQLGAFLLEIDESLSDRLDVGAGRDRIDHAPDLAVHIAELPSSSRLFCNRARSIRSLGVVIVGDEARHCVRVEKLRGDAIQDQGFQPLGRDAMGVLAPPALLVGGAAVLSRIHDDIGTATAAAPQKTGQQALRPAAHRGGVTQAFSDLLDRFPGSIVNDAQRLVVGDGPSLCGHQAAALPPRVRILAVGRLAVGELAEIEPVAQDTVGATLVACDGRCVPGAAPGARHPLVVEPLRDALGRPAGDELREDALHDRGLVRIDLAKAADRLSVRPKAMHHAIPIGQPAGRAAALDLAPLPASDLFGQVLQEDGVHRALEADVEFGNLAFAYSDDGDAGGAQPLEDVGDVLEAPGEAVLRLSDHDIEPTELRIGQHRTRPRAL
ncbi:hypothetical protein Q8A70_28470 [Rhodospirillaceae bacterium R-7]|uniref:Uncharacterized protein n=1 Tax=Dongia sedimenti TaxID=3064282 RepID=A0ABU0YVB6_9PROT|nr:hypothetical protein [Rhodospirillaceae bacterium R-7]